MKIDKKYIKIGVITLVGLGVIYGGVKLVRHFKGLNNSTDSLDSTNETEQAKTPSFNADKTVTVGSRGDEVKTIQTALNNIIADAYKIGLKSTPDAQRLPNGLTLTPEQESRRKTVANLPKLKVDGILGMKTIAVIKTIMGASSTTYNKVKQKRIDFAKAYGLGNPYGN